jgi:uncharacterized protein (UPF0212 family)
MINHIRGIILSLKNKKTTMSRLNVDIDTARKNLNSHDWVAVDMYDSLCKKCNGSILNVTLVFACDELSDKVSK